MEPYFSKEIIVSHWKNPRNFGSLKDKNRKLFLANPSCGDEIQMEAKIENDKIVKIKFSGKGCIISMATASLLTENAKGKDVSEVKKWDKDFVLNLLGIELGPTRLKCALLPLETLQKLISS